MSADEYGRHYWWVTLGDGQELGVYADRVEVSPDGSLLLYGGSTSLGAKFINLAFAPGGWQFIYAADPEDASPLAIGHWKKRKIR
jgi:hypothetical protein